MRGLFTPKNVDFGLSGQCFDFGLSEQRRRLRFVETILPTLLVETTLLIFVCQCTDKFFFDRLTREEITGGITVD